jgi:hypothetical protein
LWIWIRFNFVGNLAIGNATKMTHKSEETLSIEVLDVIFSAMKTCPVAWTSFMDA